jgi:ATP-binding cassette subfamily B protein
MSARVKRLIDPLREGGVIWWRTLRLCLRFGTGPTLLLLPLMALSGLIPAVSVQITRALTQQVQLAIAQHGSPALIRTAIFFGLAQAGIAVASLILNAAEEYEQRALLLQLLHRGGILIDGVPIEEYNLDDLRKHIGTIFQDFVQYELPVADNIGFGNLEERGNRSSLEQAARASGAAAFVERLEHGYETRLGRLFEKGEQLSVGQWQKIALARAFIGQAPIVVLDEPTASIDAEAEAEIFGTLRLAARGATTLLIAHRFSTVRMADRILVLEQGRLHEEGTHEALMRAHGLYARLFSLQAAGYLGE